MLIVLKLLFNTCCFKISISWLSNWELVLQEISFFVVQFYKVRESYGAFQFYVAQNWPFCDKHLSVSGFFDLRRLWYDFYDNRKTSMCLFFWYTMWFDSQYLVESNDPNPRSIVWRMDCAHWIPLNFDYWITWCTERTGTCLISVEFFFSVESRTKSTRTHARLANVTTCAT